MLLMQATHHHRPILFYYLRFGVINDLWYIIRTTHDQLLTPFYYLLKMMCISQNTSGKTRQG